MTLTGTDEIDVGKFVGLMFPTAAQLIANLKNNFKSWDTDGDGEISFQELQAAVKRSGRKLTEEDINAIFVIGHADLNGQIDLQCCCLSHQTWSPSSELSARR